MVTEFPRLDFGPGWRATNENLVELAGLFEGDGLQWRPAKEEWTAAEIFKHVVLARYHGPIMRSADRLHLRDASENCQSANGIQEELRKSWAMLERFLTDLAALDTVYDPGHKREPAPVAPPLLGSVERAAAGFDLGYVDHPERYTGHYIAYHRFAHDLHHRSTLVGYLSMLGVSLDGHRIRPL